MKKTINVNIGNRAFTLDEDAFRALKRYLADIRSRLDKAESQDVIEDIESRLADIFNEHLNYGGVVTITMVRGAIATIGQADVFGERQKTIEMESEPEVQKPRKLYRRRKDSVIGGVCGGVADYFGIDATVVRLLTFLFVFMGGLSLWVYVIMWIFIPAEPKANYYDRYYDRKSDR